MRLILTASLIGITSVLVALECHSAQPAEKQPASAGKPRPTSVSLSRGDAKSPVVTYQLRGKPNKDLSVESACYFHPFTTPSAVTVTEVAPDDHRHHRGIFLAFVEMHGAVDADFGGWGEHAPKENRVIVNREHRSNGSIVAENEWRTDNQIIMREHLEAALVSDSKTANILDLTYSLTPQSDVTLSRWAFSGFCVRTRKDARLTAYSPEGEMKLPNPSHQQPETDWPASRWYAFELGFDDGRVAGVAVVDHPKNPPALWHNHRDVRMLNPSIVAPGELKLKGEEPLVLRYRVVAYDGQTSIANLNGLAKDFRESNDALRRNPE